MTEQQPVQTDQSDQPTVEQSAAEDAVLVVLRGPDGETKREVEA